MKLLNQKAFSLIEVLLAVAAFGLVVTGLTGLYIYGRESSALAGNRQRATFLAEEAQEAVRNIRDQNFANLTDGTYGLSLAGNQWSLSGSSDTNSGFTRQIVITTIDANTKEIAVTINWQQNLQRPGTVTTTSRLTNWRVAAAPSNRKGMLVYGDGGTTTDDIKYKVLDGAGIWSAAASTADVDGGTSDRALRSTQVYSSSTRNEKVLISKHHYPGLLGVGEAQYIYAQVFNGTSWGNVQLLSTWSGGTFLDVQNFSGTYLANGDFMAVFSDNTTTPKFRTWNGTTWSAQVSLPDTGGIPNYVVTRARAGTNEVMSAFFDQTSDTNTIYFNGGSYVTGSWALHTEHASAAPVNTKQLIDFAWSPNNALKGGLIYSGSGADKSLNIKIWTANGTGSGSWSSVVNSSNQSNNLGAMQIVGRKGANEFMACNKDSRNPPRIICYKSDFTPIWTNPTNPTLVSDSDPGIQTSFGLGFESLSGDPALGIYSDQTTTPKLKKYTASTTTWDAAATSLNTLGGALETTKVVPDLFSDDIMILMADTNQDLYSIDWNGSLNALYTTPAGKAFSSHGTNGVADENYWYDFAWDKF